MILALASVFLVAAPARAQSAPPAGAALDLTTAALASLDDAKPPRREFTDPGSRWWTIAAGLSDNLHDATDTDLFVQYSYFFDRRVEFLAELGFWYFDQPGDNAFGVNPAMIVRWHWYKEGKLTLYADVGIGLLFTTDNVPDGGTSLDFTPRAGLGLTYEVDPDGSRLVFGARWAHISNARIIGDLDNPGRDGVMLYAGYEFPF